MNFTQIDATLGFSQLLSQLGMSSTSDDKGAAPAFAMPSATTRAAAGTSALLGYAVWEQIKFRMYRSGKKEMLAGPNFVVPLVGGIVEMVKDPYGFWEKQRKYSFPGMSWHR